MEHKGDDDTNRNSYASNNPQRFDKGPVRDGNRRTSQDHLNRSIKIGQTTEKSLGDMRKLSVTQTSVKNRQRGVLEV